MMGCASSQPVPPGGNAIAANATTDPENLVDNSNPEARASEVSSDDKYPPAEAFEISLDDVDNDNDDRSDSLIKKHPPKRLQKLVEQAATAVPATTIEHLEEKLAKAEVRRQQYIQQRIENIITLTSKGANGGVAGDGNGDGDVDGTGENGGNVDDDLNDGQNDAKAAVTVSRTNTTTTTTTNGGSSNSNSNSSQDVDVVVQPTASLNETSVSANKKHIDAGDHHDDDGHGPDNRTIS